MDTTEANSSPPRWRWVLVAVLALPAAWALYSGANAIFGTPATLGPIEGLRLGYTPSMARDRFEPGPRGEFQSEAMGEDQALVWSPVADEEIREARLEFHLGQLVAVRLTADRESELAQGPALEISDTSVLAREPEGERIALTWLARSCPTHADEVSRRISEQR